MSKSIAIIVNEGPGLGQRVHSAFHFANAAHRSEHQLIGVFFYQNGTMNALATLSVSSDEINWNQRWQNFHRDTAVPLYLCVSAGQRRGVIDLETSQNEDIAHSISSDFIASGLGELVQLIETSDRIVQF